MLIPTPTSPLAFVCPPVAAAVSPLLCGLGLVHATAITAAVLTRLVDGTRYAGFAQISFLVLLGIVGMLCGASLQLGPGASVFSAVSLAAMTLVAVADFRHPAGPGRSP